MVLSYTEALARPTHSAHRAVTCPATANGRLRHPSLGHYLNYGMSSLFNNTFILFLKLSIQGKKDMPRPSLRSRTTKRKLVRTPGGRLSLHVIPKKHDVPKCAVCKKPLRGFPKTTAREERRGHRPPGRPFGGYMCHECLSKMLKEAVRASYTS